jgi:hypothetical protein
MQRRSLAQRSLGQLALARHLHARQVLSARLSVYEQLPHLLGLHVEAFEQGNLLAPERSGVINWEHESVSGLVIPAVGLDYMAEAGEGISALDAEPVSQVHQLVMAPGQQSGQKSGYTKAADEAPVVAHEKDIAPIKYERTNLEEAFNGAHEQAFNEETGLEEASKIAQEQDILLEMYAETDSSAYNEPVAPGRAGEEVRQETANVLPGGEEQRLPEPEQSVQSVRPAKPAGSKRARGHIEERLSSVGNAPVGLPVEAAGDSHESSLTTRIGGQPETRAATPQSTGAATPGDELFQPVDTDRSPQAWLARLQQAARTSSAGDRARPTQTKAARTTPIHNPMPLAAPQAGREEMQISQQTRRFLQPLVGIDPASVPIYGDALAERRTEAAYADALAIGDAIELAPTQQDDSPRALGILAHELTHVARQRAPRFIPPVALPAYATPFEAGPSGHMYEEQLAELVEGHVRQAAQGRATASVQAYPAVAGGEDSRSMPAYPIVPGSKESGRTLEATPMSLEKREQSFWGGLPAPWEPLPGWLTSQPSDGEKGPAVAGGVVQPAPLAQAAPRVMSAGMVGGSPGETAGVQRAGRERSVDEEEQPQGDAAPAGQQAGALEPDLDALARQVYSILKRRLGVENRREG